MLNLFLLIYADDMVIFVEFPEGLQKSLNTLQGYIEEWNLTVNISKTKIVLFRNGGKLHFNESLTYNNVNLEIVNEYKYLAAFCLTTMVNS
jgi:hypothetical protein